MAANAAPQVRFWRGRGCGVVVSAGVWWLNAHARGSEAEGRDMHLAEPAEGPVGLSHEAGVVDLR